MISHGVDIIDVARIAGMIERHADDFWNRVYTPAERAYCDANPKRRAEHAAARYAAKEAVLKCLGTGWRDGIAWTDVEVRRHPSGQPFLFLSGQAALIAQSLGIRRWHLSLSHTDSLAIASAIAE
jgi:holo-[acyl-carrier protein] synthase